MNADTYKAHLVAVAEASVAGVTRKIRTLEEHLEDAREALATAEAELAAVRDGDVEFVEPTEHVTALQR